MRFFKSTLFATTLLSTSVISAQADVNVVASIKPVHSLVAAVMEGVGEPELIIEGAGSPHTYALKPSQARVLENADVVFWFGHELEAFLEKPLEAIAGDAKSVELIDAHDLIKLEFREGGAFEKHDHDDHDGEESHDDHDDHDDHKHDEHADEKKHDDHDHDEHKHDEHAEKKHDDHDHDEHKHDEHDHDDHKDDDKHDHDKHDHDEHKHEEHADEKKHDDHAHEEHAEGEHDHDEHDHGAFDAHVWLDPLNAKAIVHEIEETLAEVDPENAEKYEANAEALMAKIDALITEVSADLEPVKDKGFVVFHDAYQYFETRFGMSAVGSITVSPEVLPGAERISELHAKIKELNAVCIFSEPQFESKLVQTVTEGTNAKSGVLDPLGTGIDNGPELYFTLIKNMATSFKTCLSAS
ncbi:MAG: zinc ABC transporter substrate-binding protein [Lentilitoribacter sp.]